MLRAEKISSLTCGPRPCRCPTACHWLVQPSSAAALSCWAWWSSGSPLLALMAPQRSLVFPEWRLQRQARRLQCLTRRLPCLTRRLPSLQLLAASQNPRATFGGLCWTGHRLCWSVAAACSRMCIQAHTGSVWAPHNKHLVNLAALYSPVIELTCRLIRSGALNLHTMFPVELRSRSGHLFACLQKYRWPVRYSPLILPSAALGF